MAASAGLPADLEDAYPLARLQAGMLFHSEYSPDSAIYHDIFSYHLQAPLDLQALRAALQRLAARHPVLRTSFDLRTFSEPVQLVHRAVEIPLLVDDLRQLAPAEQEQAIAAWMEAEQRYHFDWTRPPLLRFQVHRRGEQTFQLVLSFHHAILDGWSVATMFTELFQIYLALLGNGDPPIEPAPANTFRDFVALERAALESAACREYWLRKLGDDSTTLLPRWPSDQRAPDLRVGRYEVPLAPAISDGLRELARLARVPLKSVLLAAHLRVLRLLGGQPDVTTGVLSNGRPEQTGSERALGLFLNTVPFRLRLAGGTWIDLARAAFSCEKELLPFRRYPMAEIQQITGRQPLFETIFTFIHFHVYQGLAQFHELQVLGQNTFEETSATLDANFSLGFPASQVQLALTYNTAEFCQEQICAIGGYYARTLATMAGDPHGRYETFDPLDARERHQLLVEWNATDQGARGQGSGVRGERFDSMLLNSDSWCVHHLFEAQAAQTPDAVAIVFDRPTTNDQRPTTTAETRRQGDKETRRQKGRLSPQSSVLSPQSLTYSELNDRANRLAHHLRVLGVGPEVLVGICLERSLELVIGLLGILKAGGAYLPLDPTYPQERLAFMLEDSHVAVLITANHTETWRHGDTETEAAQIVTPSPPHLVTLSGSWPTIAAATPSNPLYPVTPDHLAYMIYTSGSTGTPKGAMNTQRGIANRLLWMQDAYDLRADDRVLQKTPFSFDVSVWEFFWPLIAGATLVLARPGGQRDSAYLAQLIARERITTLHFVPSMLRPFLEEPGLAGCGCLQHVICSGEALPAELQERFFARLGDAAVALHNLYGPTEAAVDVTFWACRPGSDRERVPIGRPIANTQIYLLDDDLQPVPIGTPGELYIGGVQLARGYLNRPDLTAERFIPNPFAEVLGDGCWVMEDSTPNTQHPTPNTRLYRTGDLAHYRPDGAIEFLGRVDQQVKLRGFRIEPGEIEAALAQHPGVRECVVVAREDAPGDVRLVTYVVPKIEDRGLKIEDSGSGASEPLSSILYPLSSELRRFLQARLPDYMVPAAFVALDALPLTPSGKLDRRALPAPDRVTEPTQGFVVPRTEVEEQVAQVWAEVLRLERVGIYDNFFDLGGHSLLAIEIIFKLRDIFQVELPLQGIFDARTVAALAMAIVQMKAEHTEGEVIDELLAELEQLSEDEVQQLFAGEE